MSLIKCKECGQQVSSTASNCPRCGAAVAGKPNAQIQGTDAFIVLGSFILGLALALFFAQLAGENLGLRLAIAALFLLGTPAGALVYSSRRRR